MAAAPTSPIGALPRRFGPSPQHHPQDVCAVAPMPFGANLTRSLRNGVRHDSVDASQASTNAAAPQRDEDGAEPSAGKC